MSTLLVSNQKVSEAEVKTVQRKKAVCAVELPVNRKVKLFYTFQLQNYSAKSLRKMFDMHIDKEAKMTTVNGW